MLRWYCKQTEFGMWNCMLRSGYDSSPLICFPWKKVLDSVVIRNMMDRNVLSSDHMAFGLRDLVWFDLMNVTGILVGCVCSYAHDKF